MGARGSGEFLPPATQKRNRAHVGPCFFSLPAGLADLSFAREAMPEMPIRQQAFHHNFIGF